MEGFINLIQNNVGSCITIVVGIFSAIIAIDIGIGRKEGKKQRLYLMAIIMFLLCGVILCIGNVEEPGPVPNTEPTTMPPETTQHTEPTTKPTETVRYTEPTTVPTTPPPKTAYELKLRDYASVEASSTYDGDRATHLATNLLDGKKDTNWTEGVEGNGIGEYIQFTFNGSHTITGFRICSGNHASDSYYTKNARPKTVKLTFDDGTSEEFTFLDVKQELSFTLSKAVTTRSIRLTIESVYKGSAYEDTVISEIAFLAEK